MNRFLIALLSLAWLSPFSYGQSLFENAPDQVVEFMLTPRNEFIRVFSQKRKRLAGEKDIALFLADEDVAVELDFTSQQSSDLKRLIKESSALRKKIFDDSRTNPYVAKVKHKNSLTRYLELEKEINDSLLDHQKERLTQIHNRWLSKKSSLLVFLAGEFSNAKMALDSKQLSQLKQLSAEFEKRVAKQLKEMRGKYVSQLRENLTDRQKDELAKKIPEQFQSDFICISLAASRLDQVENDSEIDESEYWQQISQQNFYLIEPNGSLTMNPKAELDSLVALNYLWINVTSPFFEDLLLTDDQISQFRKNYLKYNKVLGEYFRNLPAEFKENPEKYYEENQKRVLELHRKETTRILKEFRESLTRPQASAMETLFGQVQCSNQGMVVWVLSQSGLKSELRVGETQKNAIVKALKQLVAKFAEDVAKLEADYERDLKRKLDAPQKKRMNELLGQPLKTTGGGPELFLGRLKLTQQSRVLK